MIHQLSVGFNKSNRRRGMAISTWNCSNILRERPRVPLLHTHTYEQQVHMPFSSILLVITIGQPTIYYSLYTFISLFIYMYICLCLYGHVQLDKSSRANMPAQTLALPTLFRFRSLTPNLTTLLARKPEKSLSVCIAIIFHWYWSWPHGHCSWLSGQYSSDAIIRDKRGASSSVIRRGTDLKIKRNNFWKL